MKCTPLKWLLTAVAFLLALTNISCAGGNTSSASAPQVQLVEGALANALDFLVTPTYDGSGQAIHPGIVNFPGGWNGFKYWLVVTPYPNYDSTKENPSILASNDGNSWSVPPGSVNPVANGNGNLADGDLFYDSKSNQLWVFYIDKATSVHLLRKTSADGVNWSAADDLLSMPPNNLVSPAVDKIGDTYWVWYVNLGTAGSSTTSTSVEYRTSSDARNWSEAHVANIVQPGYVIWHIDVLEVPSKGEQWMLAASYPTGKSSGSTKLFFAKSTDGINWTTFAKPVLDRGTGWDGGQIYRSTLLYDPSTDLIRVWYSARSSATEWHTGYTRGIYAELLNWLQAP